MWRMAWTLATMIISCTQPERVASDMQKFARYAPASGVGVLVVVAPSQCLSCSRAMAIWLSLAQRHPDRVTVVLTKPATVAERTAFALARVRPLALSETLRRSVPDDGIGLVFRDRTLERIAPLSTSSDGSMLLQRVLSILEQ